MSDGRARGLRRAEHDPPAVRAIDRGDPQPPVEARAQPFDVMSEALERALQLNSKLGRIHFFKAMTEKADGDYDGALKSLRITESLYPRDRVVLNQIARILFLKREYAAAVKVLDRVCMVDPEDVQMHYTAMLCYRGLQDSKKAAREQMLFQRFKAEESAQSITAKRRLLSPEDNNERQSVHEHVSVALNTPKSVGTKATNFGSTRKTSNVERNSRSPAAAPSGKD